MTPLAALRSHRTFDDVPPATSDEELVAWAETLLETPPAPERQPILRLRRRTEPLRAPGRDAASHGPVTTDELLDEIERRAMSVAPRLRLRNR